MVTNVEAQSQTTESVSVLADYITEDQLSAELGVCSRTLRRWHVLGEGPPRRKIGNRILYRRQSVERWLADGECAGRRGSQRRAA